MASVNFSDHVTVFPAAPRAESVIFSPPSSLVSAHAPPAAGPVLPPSPASQPSSRWNSVLLLVLSIVFALCLIYIISRVIGLSRKLSCLKSDVKQKSAAAPAPPRPRRCTSEAGRCRS